MLLSALASLLALVRTPAHCPAAVCSCRSLNCRQGPPARAGAPGCAHAEVSVTGRGVPSLVARAHAAAGVPPVAPRGCHTSGGCTSMRMPSKAARADGSRGERRRTSNAALGGARRRVLQWRPRCTSVCMPRRRLQSRAEGEGGRDVVEALAAPGGKGHSCGTTRRTCVWCEMLQEREHEVRRRIPCHQLFAGAWRVGSTIMGSRSTCWHSLAALARPPQAPRLGVGRRTQAQQRAPAQHRVEHFVAAPLSLQGQWWERDRGRTAVSLSGELGGLLRAPACEARWHAPPPLATAPPNNPSPLPLIHVVVQQAALFSNSQPTHPPPPTRRPPTSARSAGKETRAGASGRTNAVSLSLYFSSGGWSGVAPLRDRGRGRGEGHGA